MSSTSQAPARRTAAWLAPYVAALTLAAVLGLAASLWPSAIAVAAIAGVVWLGVALGRLAAALARQDGRGAARAAALVLVVAVTPGLFQLATRAGWVLRLALFQPGYDRAVAEQDPDPAGRLVLFHWGHYLIWDEVSLAYDEADWLTRPQDRQPPAFRARLAAAVDAEMQRRRNAPAFRAPRWDAAPLWGHYYVLQTHGEAPRSRPTRP